LHSGTPRSLWYRGHCPAATPRYVTNPDLVAAGTLLTAITTLLDHSALQSSISSDLTSGSGKD
jgi:hypothetical protein